MSSEAIIVCIYSEYWSLEANAVSGQEFHKNRETHKLRTLFQAGVQAMDSQKQDKTQTSITMFSTQGCPTFSFWNYLLD